VGRNPGGVRVLLAGPRWERRFVKFLELSGVGRAVADGTDEDGARAARMDEWFGRRWKRQPPGVGVKLGFSLGFSFVSFCKGGSYPESCAPRTAEVKDFICSSRLTEGHLLVPFVFPRPHIPWGWTALSQESNKINNVSGACGALQLELRVSNRGYTNRRA
jgi:hypothetical protein